MPPRLDLILLRAYCSRTTSLFSKRERSHFQANDRFDPLITLSSGFRERPLRDHDETVVNVIRKVSNEPIPEDRHSGRQRQEGAA